MSLSPLEANPEVMTKLLHKMGVPKQWNIVDVYGLDPEMLAILLKPVLAMILLYPQNYEQEAVENAKEPYTNVSRNVYFMNQSLSNACGTIALIHSVANNLEEIQLEDGFLKTFFEKTKNLSSVERGEQLKAEDIIEIHKELLEEEELMVPSDDVEDVSRHFVAFVQKDGHIYELDGVKESPVNHGKSTPDSFLEDVARVCQEYMKRDPNEIRYTMVALVPAD